MLSQEDLKQIAAHSDETGRYIFDMSLISTDFYEPLLTTLQKFAQKRCVSLGFTCDELEKVEKKGEEIPQNIKQSIAYRKTHYIRNIIELLCHILPKRTNLKEIVLSALNLNYEFIERISIAFSRCETLESIVFRNIPLMDNGLNSILSKIDPNKIKVVTFHNCSLSSASINIILKFIARKTDENGLREFNVSKTEFLDKDRERILNALNGDLRSSSPSPIKRLNKRFTSEEIELSELRKENEELKKQLMSLRESVNAVQYSENVFVVGNGAEEFVSFLRTVESKIAKLEDKIVK